MFDHLNLNFDLDGDGGIDEILADFESLSTTALTATRAQRINSSCRFCRRLGRYCRNSLRLSSG